MEGDRPMDWKTLLAYITGSVDQALLWRNEYLVMEQGHSVFGKWLQIKPKTS